MVKLTKKEVEYIQLATKLTVFPVNIEDRFISVPHNRSDEASDDLTVRMLMRDYDFKIQLSLDAEIREEFRPEFRERVKADTTKVNNIETGVGCVFKDRRYGGTRTIVGEKQDYWIIEMQSGNSYPMRKISVDIAVDHGLWERDSG